MRGSLYAALGCACLGLAGFAFAAPAPVAPACRDLQGRIVRPLDTSGAQAVLLIFVAKDCPISNSYSPEINRLAVYCRANGVRMELVDIDSAASVADIARHARDYGYVCPVVLDRDHKLAHTVGATVTPEAVLLDSRGNIAYRGRIDDRYLDFGKVRQVARVHDLRDAIAAVLAGTRPSHPRTKAVGCFIS